IWVVGPTSEHWDGKTWSAFPLNGPAGTFLYGVAATDANHAWGVGIVSDHLDEAALLTWDGAKWNYVPTGESTNSSYSRVAATAAENIWVVGGTWATAVTLQGDGTNWVRHEPPNYYLNDVATLAFDDVYAVGQAIMHYDGSTWQVFAVPPHALNGVSASSA